MTVSVKLFDMGVAGLPSALTVAVPKMAPDFNVAEKSPELLVNPVTTVAPLLNVTPAGDPANTDI
jgi:hypothetical protein